MRALFLTPPTPTLGRPTVFLRGAAYLQPHTSEQLQLEVLKYKIYENSPFTHLLAK